jgi:hypothetical protein
MAAATGSSHGHSESYPHVSDAAARFLTCTDGNTIADWTEIHPFLTASRRGRTPQPRRGAPQAGRLRGGGAQAEEPPWRWGHLLPNAIKEEGPPPRELDGHQRTPPLELDRSHAPSAKMTSRSGERSRGWGERKGVPRRRPPCGPPGLFRWHAPTVAR